MADPQGGASAGPAASSGPSLFGSLRSFWSVLLATLYTRLDLATVELQDQGVRALKLVLFAFAAVLTLHTAFFFALLWILAAFWDTPYRLWVIGGIFGIYALCGAAFVLAGYNIISNWPGFLGQTIKELRRDVEGLQDLIARDKEVSK
ncbi:MAG TPA: phage holin family protein [Candidatus Methylacidiphilales bacterium]|jgi:uncharacterized membrane protein YqjE|nr:phage holin family protein [Candidatus Methylacidiphilales bacterium]